MNNNQNPRAGIGRNEGMATASADEVARFAAIADAWWDPYGEFRPLPRLNPTRIA